jgi:hypothetical protein
MLVALWHMLKRRVPHQDLGGTHAPEVDVIVSTEGSTFRIPPTMNRSWLE